MTQEIEEVLVTAVEAEVEVVVVSMEGVVEGEAGIEGQRDPKNDSSIPGMIRISLKGQP